MILIWFDWYYLLLCISSLVFILYVFHSSHIFPAHIIVISIVFLLFLGLDYLFCWCRSVVFILVSYISLPQSIFIVFHETRLSFDVNRLECAFFCFSRTLVSWFLGMDNLALFYLDQPGNMLFHFLLLYIHVFILYFHLKRKHNHHQIIKFLKAWFFVVVSVLHNSLQVVKLAWNLTEHFVSWAIANAMEDKKITVFLFRDLAVKDLSMIAAICT